MGLTDRVKKLEDGQPCPCSSAPPALYWPGGDEPAPDASAVCPKCGKPLVTTLVWVMDPPAEDQGDDEDRASDSTS